MLLEFFRRCLKVTKAGDMKIASQLYSSTFFKLYNIVEMQQSHLKSRPIDNVNAKY